MKNLLKTILAIPVIACSSSLVAATQDPCCPPKQPACVIPVTVSAPDYAFKINFAGMALRPIASNLEYAAEAVPFNYGDTDPAISPSWVIQEVSPDYHFGFDLGISGVFQGEKSNLMLNWEWYHSPTDSNSFTVSNPNFMVGPFFEIGPDASLFKKVTGTVKFHFDEVNLNYGTFVQFGNSFNVNLFGGLSYGRVHQHLFTTFSNLPGTLVRTLEVPSTFWGIGPQMGSQCDYQLGNGFQFVGGSRATLFIGSFKNSTTFSTSSNLLVISGNQNPNIQTTTMNSQMGIVPGLEAKLGFAYESLFNCDYLFKIEVGYQAQLYLNAIRSIDMGSEVDLGTVGAINAQEAGVYARTFKRTISDFGLAGAYATIDVAF